MKEKRNSKEKTVKEKSGIFANHRTAIGIIAVILLAVMLVWVANPHQEKSADKESTPTKALQATKKIADSQPTAVANSMIVVNSSVELPPTPTPTPEIIISAGEASLRNDLPVISLEAPDKVSAGDIVTVNITVTPGKGKIGGMEMAVIFSNGLQAEKVILGDALSPELSSGGTIKNSEGAVSDIIAQPVDFNSGFPAQKFTLVTVTFIAVTKGEATIAIKKFSAVDLDSNLIPAAIVNKKVTIG